MTHSTTCVLLLTAPVGVPFAVSAVCGVSAAGARPRAATPEGVRPPAQRARAERAHAAAGAAAAHRAPGEGPSAPGLVEPAGPGRGRPRRVPGAPGPGDGPATGMLPGAPPRTPARGRRTGWTAAARRLTGRGRSASASPERHPGRGRDLPGPGAEPSRGGAADRYGRERAGQGRTSRFATPWLALLSPLTVLACAVALARTVTRHGPVAAYGLRADALSVWILLTVGAVAVLACAASGPEARTARRYHALVHAFLGTLATAVLAANLGVVWIAIEATTILTAFLVGHRRTRASVEAAWKYVLICSAGIALAFLGTVLLYYAARRAGIPEASALDWPALAARAGELDPAVTRLGTGLIVLGFGAKAGLAPLHAWLPDAYGQAPAPVSALMSGVLSAVAFTALLRYKVIADAALGPGWTRALLTATALLTLALAAALLLAQRDHQRMLAYSSMEHMSLIALGAAVGGPLAASAMLLHIMGHGLAKAVAFRTAGHVLRLRDTSRIGRVRGLLAQAPGVGALFALAVLALLGLPPFGLFAAELGLVRAGFAAGMGAVMGIALLLLLVAFAALGARAARMLLGPPPLPGPPARLPASEAIPLAGGLLLCAALGVTTGPLTGLLADAAAIVGGR
ncbi:proton-conducting transporter transmembrane domain-containing protein [Streptomyces hesseae]|uniref:Proton-conducting transporter membrane subunit n=1 Tax=Streptomyces hesseae TaxID=3075519 RepID=A0ABU2SG78_9ACTN|nr:proton-conducting transporter membrane subunit [Streptomyces sp. DSM 40473]MDT0447984.1 proton-conducting transporter membrane subunit [Streptomyces sp. DSM 40473]